MRKGQVEKHFDKVAKSYDSGKKKYSYYYENLKILLGGLIPKKYKVFEVGCGTGDLLASLNPEVGYGMDISETMIKVAKFKYKVNRNLTFSTAWPLGSFDFIFMSDVIEHLERPGETFKYISKSMDTNSKFIITMANPIWEPALMVAEKLGLKMPEGPHKRIKHEDIEILIKEAEMKIIKHDYKLLIPVKVPVITNLANRYLEKYLKKLSFIEYIVVVKS